jgi:hypothetical protein
MSEILTIAEASRRIAARKLSPVELTKAHLERIKRLDPSLNAFLLVTEERALADAMAAEARQMSGGLRGRLDGIPIAHKDIYNTAGIRTTAHSRLLEKNVPSRDAHTVKKWADAGTAGQALDARVRLRRPVLRRAVAAGAQSLEPRALHRRIVLRHRRGGRRRTDPGRNRIGHRRLDPRAGGAVRHRRHQADLWLVEPRRHPAARLHA